MLAEIILDIEEQNNSHSSYFPIIKGRSYYKTEIAIYIELKLKTTTSERYQKISLVERL